MEFTVSKTDLVRELNLSQGVVEKKTTIPILSNVLVEATGDRINLTATDLELGIRSSCPARVKKQGAGTIPAKRLLDYVRLLPDADLEVKLQDNQWASLVCGRSRTRIAGMSRESFPELPQMPDVLAQIPVGVLASMISRTIFAISMEESRFTLNGSLLLLKSNGIGDGGDGRASIGDGGASNRFARRDERVSRIVAAQGDGRDFEAGAGSRTRMPSWRSRATTTICSSSLASGCC